MSSLVPSDHKKKELEQAVESYAQSLKGSLAESYLRDRGITDVAQDYFRLGYVENPEVGHEAYKNRLSIPYLTRSGVVSLRFRAVDADVSGPKYLSLPGEEARVYNVKALQRQEQYICVTEGEIDAITASMCGLPAVGIPGASMWKPYFFRMLRWYDHVFVMADNDDTGAGMAFAEKVARSVKNVSIILMPEGHDLNSFYVMKGRDAVLEKLGLLDE